MKRKGIYEGAVSDIWFCDESCQEVPCCFFLDSKFFLLNDLLNLTNEGINYLHWYVSVAGEVRIGYELKLFFSS